MINENRATIKALVNCMCWLLYRLGRQIGTETADREIDLIRKAVDFDNEQDIKRQREGARYK